MQRIISLSLIAMFVLVLSGCKKRQARKTLIGTWQVEKYEGYFHSDCGNSTRFLWGWTGPFGTIVFDKNTVVMNYELFEDQGECYPESSSAHTGEYEVSGYDSELDVVHTYHVEMNGELWKVTFEDESSAAAEANGQDLMRIAKDVENDLYLTIWLSRTD